MINSVPVIWVSKRQGSVESSSYGAEFVALRTTIEEIEDLRFSLRMMGVKITQPCTVFCDNNSVFKSSTIPGNILKKKHLRIANNMEREASEAHEIDIRYIKTNENPSNPLTKTVTSTDLKILDDMFFHKENKPWKKDEEEE